MLFLVILSLKTIKNTEAAVKGYYIKQLFTEVEVNIYWAVKRQVKYPPLSPTLRWIIDLVYTTEAE